MGKPKKGVSSVFIGEVIINISMGSGEGISRSETVTDPEVKL
jgi:hypothetical protein